MVLFQDPIRWRPLTDVVDGYSPTLPHLKGLQNGDTATSAIKQVVTLISFQNVHMVSHFHIPGERANDTKSHVPNYWPAKWFRIGINYCCWICSGKMQR